MLQFCDFVIFEIQQRYILQEEVNISERELTSLVDSLLDFLKSFDDAGKCIQVPLPKPKIKIGSTKSKDNLFVQYYNDIIEHPNRQIHLPFRFGNNNSCVFSIKKFELHGNRFILTEIVQLSHRENHHLQLPSSTFLSTNPKAIFNLAAHLRVPVTAFTFFNRYFGPRVSMAKL